MCNIKPAGYLNKFTGMIWNPEQQPVADGEPEIYEPLVRLSDVHGLVAENAELKNRTVKVPAKVYVKDMKSNVVRWAQVIDALSDAGVAFVRDDGELIAGTRETPATDAAIAEIKAQGADVVAEYHKVRVDALIGVDRKGANEHKVSYMAARDVSANLRAGRKE